MSEVSTLKPQIREAAMLISSLDSASADLLLEQMGEEQAAQVRAAVMTLEDISDDQFAQLMAKFVGKDQEPAPQSAEINPGVLLDLSSDEEVDAREQSVEDYRDEASEAAFVEGDVLTEFAERHEESSSEPTEDSATFHQLAELADAELAPLLAQERPQTIAAVLARLSPELAARVLSRFTFDLQTEVVQRIAHMQPANDSAMAEVEASLSQALLRHGASWGEPSRGLQAMQAILNSVDQAHREQLMGNLQQQDHQLARDLHSMTAGATVDFDGIQSGPVVARHEATSDARQPEICVDFSFEQIADLDGESLSKVLLAAPWRVVLLALAGADRRMMHAISAHLPPSQRHALQRQIEQQGPLRLRDIDQAQDELVKTAKELIAGGEVSFAMTNFVSAA